MALAAGIAATVFASSVIAEAGKPRVTDLRFCDAQHFSVPDRVCTRAMDRFAYGTNRVYVSFGIQNWPSDQPFTRTWYLNGQSVLERTGLAAPPWEGWTWYGSANPEGADAAPVRPGLYTLRVRVGDAIRASTFEVATPELTDPGVRFRDPFFAGRGDGPEMIVLPVAGPGEPGLGYRLAVSRSEITWNDWLVCVEDGGCSAHSQGDPGVGDRTRPATNVSWDDAFAYLLWLNGKLGLAPERWDRYTLLTGAEWDHVARAAPSGPSELTLTATQPAGSGDDHPWQLQDIEGNAAEWVLDCQDLGESKQTGPCRQRSIRGASFERRADVSRTAAPDARLPDVGFRIARRLDPLQAEQWDSPAP